MIFKCSKCPNFHGKKSHETLEQNKDEKLCLNKVKSPPIRIMFIKITQTLFVIFSTYILFFPFQENIMSSSNEDLIGLKIGQLSVSSEFSSIDIEEFILPEEIWIMIWKYLDFKTLQKVCTQVSKSWLEMIRSSKPSWEFKRRYTRNYHSHVLTVFIISVI